MALSLSRHDEAGTLVVEAHGEIDLLTAGDLERELTGAIGAAQAVRVDLGGVTFIDSAGISALLKARRAADDHGHGIRIVNAHGIIREVLDMTGVWGHLSGGAG